MEKEEDLYSAEVRRDTDRYSHSWQRRPITVRGSVENTAQCVCEQVCK